MKRYFIIFTFLFLLAPYTYCSFFEAIKSDIEANTEAQKEIELKNIKEGKKGSKPVSSSYATNWLDNFHDSLFLTVQGQITRADTMFVKDNSAITTPHSRFELALYIELEQGNDSAKLAVDPKFDIDLAVPNLERSLKIYINNTPVGSLPGIDPVDEDRTLHIGVQSTLEKRESWLPKFSTSIGVDWNWPPDPYIEFHISKYLNFGNLRLYPKQSFWLNTTDRLSEQSTLRAEYWLSKNMLTTIWSSIKYTQDDGFFSWEQSQSVIYRLNGHGLNMDTHQMHYCNLKFSLFGDNTVIKTYRLTMQYKFPIYKDWIFLELTPELKFEKDTDWEPIRVFRVGISALFWGLYNTPR